MVVGQMILRGKFFSKLIPRTIVRELPLLRRENRPNSVSVAHLTTRETNLIKDFAH